MVLLAEHCFSRVLSDESLLGRLALRIECKLQMRITPSMGASRRLLKYA